MKANGMKISAKAMANNINVKWRNNVKEMAKIMK